MRAKQRRAGRCEGIEPPTLRNARKAPVMCQIGITLGMNRDVIAVRTQTVYQNYFRMGPCFFPMHPRRGVGWAEVQRTQASIRIIVSLFRY